MPFSSASDAALMAFLISSYVALVARRTVRSTTDTSGVGTRNAMPVSLPLSAGSTCAARRACVRERASEQASEQVWQQQAAAVSAHSGLSHLAHSLGSARGGRDDVLASTAAAAPVLAAGAVDRLLRGSGGVHSGHQALDNAKLLVDDLGERRQAIGGARRVAQDIDVRRVPCARSSQ